MSGVFAHNPHDFAMANRLSFLQRLVSLHSQLYHCRELLLNSKEQPTAILKIVSSCEDQVMAILSDDQIQPQLFEIAGRNALCTERSMCPEVYGGPLQARPGSASFGRSSVRPVEESACASKKKLVDNFNSMHGMNELHNKKDSAEWDENAKVEHLVVLGLELHHKSTLCKLLRALPLLQEIRFCDKDMYDVRELVLNLNVQHISSADEKVIDIRMRVQASGGTPQVRPSTASSSRHGASPVNAADFDGKRKWVVDFGSMDDCDELYQRLNSTQRDENAKVEHLLVFCLRTRCRNPLLDILRALPSLREIQFGDREIFHARDQITMVEDILAIDESLTPRLRHIRFADGQVICIQRVRQPGPYARSGAYRQDAHDSASALFSAGTSPPPPPPPPALTLLQP